MTHQAEIIGAETTERRWEQGDLLISENDQYIVMFAYFTLNKQNFTGQILMADIPEQVGLIGSHDSGLYRFCNYDVLLKRRRES